MQTEGVYWQKENKNNGWFSKRFTLWNLGIMRFFFPLKASGFRGYWINHLESPIMFIMLVKPASSFQKNPTTVPALRIYRGMLGHLHFLSRQPSLRQARCFGDSKAIGGHWKAHVEHTLLCQTVSRLSSTVTRVQQCAIVQIESEFCLDRETTLTVTCLRWSPVQEDLRRVCIRTACNVAMKGYYSESESKTDDF